MLCLNSVPLLDFQCMPYASLKMCDCVDIDYEISNVSLFRMVWASFFFFSFFLRWFTIALVTVVHCNFIFSVIFKIGIVICNQTNVSNNKRRIVPLGPFPTPQKIY